MDFLMPAMDQMVNHLAKWSYMSGGTIKTPVVIRSLIGRGWGSAAQHSQCLHALFAHIPGLKIVMPSTPYDAKGLFLSCLKEKGPVLFLEYRWLYKHVGFVPKKPYTVPLGEATVKKEGKRDIHPKLRGSFNNRIKYLITFGLAFPMNVILKFK